MADDAPWLPEGAFIALGPCQVGGCDRVGWALPTYGQLVIEFSLPPGVPALPPHTMEGVLLQATWWCPVHGYGTHRDIAKKWAQSVMDDLKGAVTLDPRYVHEGHDISYVIGPNTKISMAQGKRIDLYDKDK